MFGIQSNVILFSVTKASFFNKYIHTHTHKYRCTKCIHNIILFQNQTRLSQLDNTMLKKSHKKNVLNQYNLIRLLYDSSIILDN